MWVISVIPVRICWDRLVYAVPTDQNEQGMVVPIGTDCATLFVREQSRLIGTDTSPVRIHSGRLLLACLMTIGNSGLGHTLIVSILGPVDGVVMSGSTIDRDPSDHIPAVLAYFVQSASTTIPYC